MDVSSTAFPSIETRHSGRHTYPTFCEHLSAGSEEYPNVGSRFLQEIPAVCCFWEPLMGKPNAVGQKNAAFTGSLKRKPGGGV